MIVLRTIQGASSYTLRANLDGAAYTLELNWNGRESAWYLSVADANGVPLLQSRKLSTNWPTLHRFRYVTGLPAGELMACDPSGLIDYAGYTDLGPDAAVHLVYFTADEVAASPFGGAQ